MFKELFESFKINRDELVPSKKFIVYIDNKERFKLTNRGTKWIEEEMSSQSSAEEKKWTKNGTKFNHFNGAEVIDNYINQGYNVTKVEVQK